MLQLGRRGGWNRLPTAASVGVQGCPGAGLAINKGFDEQTGAEQASLTPRCPTPCPPRWSGGQRTLSCLLLSPWRARASNGDLLAKWKDWALVWLGFKSRLPVCGA